MTTPIIKGFKNTSTIAAGATYRIPIDKDILNDGALNELVVLNGSTEKIRIILNGDTTQYFPCGVEVTFSFEKKDKIFFTAVDIYNDDAANTIAANEITVTIRRV